MAHPPLLLLHGALGSAAQFEQIIPILADRYDVYWMDFEGHGPRPSRSEFSVERFADNVLEFLDSYRMPKIDVFGYSMGGYVAMWLAHRQPEHIGRILTLNTKYFWTPEVALSENAKMDADTIEAKVPAFARMLAARHTGIGWREVLARTRAMLTTMGDHNLLTEDVLRTITNRVRIAVGDQDTTVSIEEVERVCAALPNADVVVLPDAPHALEKIGTDRVVRLIEDFFAQQGNETTTP